MAALPCAGVPGPVGGGFAPVHVMMVLAAVVPGKAYTETAEAGAGPDVVRDRAEDRAA